MIREKAQPITLTLEDRSIKRVFALSFLIGFIFWFLAAFRHFLLQSNAFDLGLFDQWVWLQSVGEPPYSSMTGLHLMADHGAWLLYIPAFLYKIQPSIHWLLATQSFSLSFTSLPLWMLCKQKGLNNRKSWLICCLWWLQPVVFNVNIFDFHPEVWAMPLLAFSYLSIRANKNFLWIFLIFIILGTRDGLVLLTLGLGFEQILRRNFTRGISVILLSSSWLLFLNNILYPLLNQGKGSIMAVSRYSYLGNSLEEILFKIITNPIIIFQSIDWSGSIFYLIILFLPFIFFLRSSSLIVLSASIPLLLTNILSDSFSQRTLIHHYSLPIIMILVVASIDGMAQSNIKSEISIRNRYLWILLTWSLLAKPLFFIGPYLSRISLIQSAHEAFSLIKSDSSILTTSYLAPHLTQRSQITFPRDTKDINSIDIYDVILLNPLDPGWQSDRKIQEEYLSKARLEGWDCKEWSNGQELCISD